MNYKSITAQLTQIIAQLCITTLGAIALSQGMDGAVFAACIAALAGLGGYAIKSGNGSKLNKTP